MSSSQPRITVLGLGTGDEDQLTLGVWKKLQQAAKSETELFLRTKDHPMVQLLDNNAIPYETFDANYVSHASFEGVYESIAEELISTAKSHTAEVLYAVPGHPMVAEYTVQLLKQRCPSEGIELQITGGESFLDQAFLRFGFDPIEGFQLLDATSLNRYTLNPLMHTVIGQVYDTYTASDLKISLMESYPDEYRVVVGHALGVAGQEQIIEVPLHELDHVKGYGNLSLVWVPRSEQEEPFNRTFGRLHEIIQTLRSPGGCPWDQEQTHESLRKNLIEEAYEVLETIDEDDPEHMCEELGDLLLQVMLHAQMEEEVGTFTVYDVIATLNEKLIRRHPHVFGEKAVEDADEALVNWNAIKAEEKRKKGIDVTKQSVLDGIPRELPGLMKAIKLQKKAATVGFDWTELSDVLAKVEEEFAELREAIANPAQEDNQNRRDELGDVLFSIVNVARFLKIDPEEALSHTNRKFIQRFTYMEEQLRLRGQSFEQTELSEMEFYWQEAKKVTKLDLT
ncbi:bifunctional methyltransferase/pyrophosphohydrolase YabN [Paenibacillus roseipurpureus]|uniref:Nucleoside triphosphate pyrophosphohydrolase n=1 Tax=Paenibacillus roseopurpureus TaxID=2918901 RepID=A0AA96LPD6_9BACL|nr:nucleoside triphosphate pyrophosphohydrolase [Paenibacillus sp. MBLB1832]WNR44774.1 nucleoside triphosphate pyrophosphohydrolase [Paenibacillus sp. MBLB1832]